MLLIQESLVRRATYDIFSVHTWDKFSNYSPRGDGRSLEGIHNRMHGAIGGHMAYPEFAGIWVFSSSEYCNI